MPPKASAAPPAGLYGMMRMGVTCLVSFTVASILWGLVYHRNFAIMWLCILTAWAVTVPIPGGVSLDAVLVLAGALMASQYFGNVRNNLQNTDDFLRME